MKIPANLLSNLAAHLGLSSGASPNPSYQILCDAISAKLGVPTTAHQKHRKTRILSYIKKHNSEITGLSNGSEYGEYCIYIIQKGGGGFPIKIGFTRNIKDRIKTLETGSEHPLFLIGVLYAKNKGQAIEIEKGIHSIIAPHRMAGEWFNRESVKLLHKIGIIPEGYSKGQTKLDALREKYADPGIQKTRRKRAKVIRKFVANEIAPHQKEWGTNEQRKHRKNYMAKAHG